MRVFCYGTLRKGYHNHRVIEPYVASIEPGVVRGTMHEGPGFPYVVPCGDGLVHGEWVSIRPGSEAKALSAVDRLEGYHGSGQDNHYDRVMTQDALEPNIEGWLYVAGPDLDVRKRYPVILSGDWTLREASLYFAYGSCMNEADFRRTCSTAKDMGTAQLPGYQLRFNGYSAARRGGIANVERKKGAVVEGVLWQIVDPQERKRLRAREGAPHVYREELIRVRVADGWTWAFTYKLVRPFHIDIAPAYSYLQLLFDSPVSPAYKEEIVQWALAAPAESQTQYREPRHQAEQIALSF